MQSKYLFTLYCLVVIVCVATANTVIGQSCFANTLVSNMTSSSQSVICPVGYAADILKLQCRPYDTVFDENYGKPCNFTKECSLSFVCSTLQKVCVPFETRKIGESCLAKESCIGSLNCVSGVCSYFTTSSYDRKKGEKCNYIDYSTNTMYYCANSLICTGNCYERVNSGIGEFCSYNSTSYQYGVCVSGLTCNYNTYKCIPSVYNATIGDNCYTTSDINVNCLSSLSCLSGKCYSTIYVGTGQPCYYQNTTSYTYSYCFNSLSESNYCRGGTCVRSINSPIGGYCGINSTHDYTCSGACFNSTCIPSVTSNEGGVCGITNSTGVYSCASTSGPQLICYNNACKKLGKKNEGCSLTSQCEYGLTCLYSKCTNLNGKTVGEVCKFNSDCDSGLCLNSICSLDFNSTTCTSDSSCSGYESKCSCGSGKSSSNTYGTCASMKRCKAYLAILYACLGNNARGISLSAVFDRNSPTHKTCAKEFSQYYSCMRIGLTKAGSVPAISISGLDVNTDIDIDPAPAKFYKCSVYYSSDYLVCVGRGDCIGDEVCRCYSGFYGPYCQYTVAPQSSKAPTPPIPVKSIGNNNGGGDRNGTNVSNANTVNNTMMITFNLMVMIILCVILY